ncbi:hypothetical protein C8J25_107282 [Sphingomonas faeni]|uniref:Uncharacterized protein n=1 Tax=Sphingomonas faeni TaxID=185950 RepID=A0A2T5U266_9SPHN|nr:hypothetical protein [Sphingomonas faeni]PTW45597.1 hypothetical protein C8J25_107282 [Sphingomonas faeni]
MALTINNPKYGNILVVADTIAELRTVSTKQIQDGYSAIVAGDLSPGDGFGGLLVWNATSTAADDSRTVIASSDGQPGRWVKIAVGQTGATGATGAQGSPSTVPGPQGPVGPVGTVTPEVVNARDAAQLAATSSATSANTANIAATNSQTQANRSADFAGAAQAAAAGAIYPDTTTALAAVTTEGAPFLVQGGPNNAYATLYRNVAGAAASQNLSIPSAAALADLKANYSAQSIKAVTAGGDLPNGTPIGSGAWLIPPATGATIAATNPDVTRKGVKYVVKVAPGSGVAFQVNHQHAVDIGQYVYGSVIVTKANGAAYPVKSGATEYLTIGNVPQNGGVQQGFAQSDAAAVVKVEDISANSRRYVLGGQLTTVAGPLNFSFIYVQNTTATEIQVSGFAIATAPSKASDIDYTDYDPTQTGALDVRLDAVETATGNIAEPIPAGGDLPNGAPKYNGSWLVPPASGSITPATNATLLSLGVEYEHHLVTNDGSYFRIDLPSDVYAANGDFVMGSVILRKNTATAWSSIEAAGEFLTISCIPTDNATQNNVSVTAGATRTFEVISDNIRRYKITAQLTTLSSPLDWVIVYPHAFPAEMWVSGFAFATSNRPIVDLDYTEFDYARGAEFNTRLTNIEAVVGTADPQPEPLMLFPSSLPVIQGQPMPLYRSRLTERGTSTAYKFAVIGRGSRLEAVRWDDGKQLAVDGARLSGSGYIIAQNATGTFRRPVNFRSSPATKTGNPTYKLLTIGDSLSQQGQTSILEAKLIAAGVPVTMLGTFKDTGGSWGETRASWAALTYTNAQTAVNSDGSGGISPVSSPSSYLALATPYGGPNDDYGPRWGSNPFIRPATGSDPTASVKNGYIFDFQSYLTRFNVAVPTSVDINLFMNDYLRGFSVADSMASLDIMVRSIRAVSPSINISFGCFGHQAEGSQTGLLTFTKAILTTYGNREAERFYVLPLWEVVDPEIGYAFAALSGANAYGVEPVSVSDGIHPPRLGTAHGQWAQLRFAHHMNLIA